MNTLAQDRIFSTANPHALATILDASQTKSIIASRDIFDISGTKLWAREQPVSQALQRKLLDRQLRRPLETCLMAEDGITAHSLVESLEASFDRAAVLSPILRPHAAKLLREVVYLPLHAVAQLLLTAGQATRPETFNHAVQAMALNGAIAIAHNSGTEDIRVAMLCGLLHDLGEMYIAPQYGEADAGSALDAQAYRHMVVHPHVGRLLLEQLTDYPGIVARAVAEHHERLDGSGYPYCLQREGICQQGRQLAITEAVLGSLRGEGPSLSRASVALRVVPGEFDLSCVGLVAQAGRDEPPLKATLTQEDARIRMALLDGALQTAETAIGSSFAAAQSVSLKEALVLAQQLLNRLRKGWNACGLWSENWDDCDAGELEAIEQELLYRLSAIHRATVLRAGKLAAAEEASLNQLAEQLGAC